MAEDKAVTEEVQSAPLSVFITDGDTGVGLALTKTLVRAGARVTAASTTGSKGAAVIRAAGALPVYPDVFQTGELASLMRMANTDVVVHLAGVQANGIPHLPLNYTVEIDRLVTSTENVVAAASRAGVKRIILISSAGVYGDHHGAEVDENTKVSRKTPLFEAFEQAETCVLDGGIPGYVLRAGYIYGGSHPSMKAVATMIKEGRGVPVADGLAGYITEIDLADAIATIAQRDFSEDEATATIYNVVDDKPASSGDFLNALGEELGLHSPARANGGLIDRFFPKDKSTHDIILDNSAKPSNAKIKAELGWSPQYASYRLGLDQALLAWRAADAPTTETVTTSDSKAVVAK